MYLNEPFLQYDSFFRYYYFVDIHIVYINWFFIFNDLFLTENQTLFTHSYTIQKKYFLFALIFLYLSNPYALFTSFSYLDKFKYSFLVFPLDYPCLS